MSTSTTAPRVEMVELTSRGANTVVWTYFVTVAVLAVWTLGNVHSPYPTLIAVALFGATCVALTRSRGARIGFSLSLMVIAVGVTASLLVWWQLIEPRGYAQWFFGAGIAGLFLVGLRGRIGLAWIGFALIGAVGMVWGVTTGLGWATALFIVVKQAPILIVGTLFAVGLRRADEQVRRFTAEAAARAVTEQEQLAISQEREFRLKTLGGTVSPMLELLARGETPSAQQRLEFALAEAELRDSLRARALTGTEVTAAAREARRRGVEVILLDDSDPDQLTPQDLGATAQRIAAVLNATREGRVTARLLPPGRATLASIVVDGADHVREDVPRAD